MLKMRQRGMSAMLTVMLLCTLCVTSVVAKDAGNDKLEEGQVTLLFTHDLHSRMDEYKTEKAGSFSSQSVSKDRDEPDYVGGFARLKTRIDERRAENPATVVLDGGDFSMGTLYQTIYESHAAELTMLGRLGYDATTFGNHEFDYRAQGVANMFHSALKNAQEDSSLVLPQFLSANIDWEKNNSNDNRLIMEALEDYGSTPYTVLERGGHRIGVYGIAGEDAEACAPESGLEFEDIVEASKEAVKSLKKEDVDMIVCLSHSGTNVDRKKSEDEILAEEVPDIDVIISAHTHTSLPEPIIQGDTMIVSAGCYGESLGELDLIPGEDGRWKIKQYELQRMDTSVAQDEATLQELAVYKEIVDDTYLKAFGYTADQVLAENRVAFTQMDQFAEGLKEDSLGSLIADSYSYAVEQAEGDGYDTVDVAVVPSGVVRDTFQKGPITVSDVFNVSSLGIGADRIPGYPLVSVYLTGAELMTAAEIDVSISPLMTTAQLYPSGMKWVYNPSRLILNRVTEAYLTDKALGNSVESYKENLQDIDDEQLYRVVAGLYSAQMLGAVEEQSMGILKLQPKDRDGRPIKDFEEHIIHDQNGMEVKEWYALAGYLESFSQNEKGMSQVPGRYERTEGRKAAKDSKNILSLLKHPNTFAWVVYGVVLAIVLLLVLLICLVIRKKRRKRSCLQMDKM